MATFFTYKGRNNKYDFKSTEHSGCPVIEGEKWIATAWLREGVNDKLTHLHVDPSGFAIESEPLDETPQVRTTKAVQMEEDTEINLEEKSHDEL